MLGIARSLLKNLMFLRLCGYCALDSGRGTREKRCAPPCLAPAGSRQTIRGRPSTEPADVELGGQASTHPGQHKVSGARVERIAQAWKIS